MADRLEVGAMIGLATEAHATRKASKAAKVATDNGTTHGSTSHSVTLQPPTPSSHATRPTSLTSARSTLYSKYDEANDERERMQRNLAYRTIHPHHNPVLAWRDMPARKTRLTGNSDQSKYENGKDKDEKKRKKKPKRRRVRLGIILDTRTVTIRMTQIAIHPTPAKGRVDKSNTSEVSLCGFIILYVLPSLSNPTISHKGAFWANHMSRIWSTSW